MRVVMLVKSDVTGDARVLREAETLSARGYEVTVLGHGPIAQHRLPGGAEVRLVGGGSPLDAHRDRAHGSQAGPHIRAARWVLLPTHRRLTERSFSRALLGAAAELPPADVVHAHDFTTLAAGVTLAESWGARLVYDAHECWVGRGLVGRPTPLQRRIDRRTEARLGARADAVITVSPGIAEWFAAAYGWPAPAVVRNTFPAAGGSPTPRRPERPSGLVYAGRIDPKRDLATLLRARQDGLAVPPRVLGPADAAYAAHLEAEGLLLEPSKPIDEVDEVYRGAGLALVSLADGWLNHRLALPNKLFQAVRAGVPVVASDLPEMRRLVTTTGIGTLYRPGDPDSLREAVAEAVDRYDELCAAVSAARPALTWEVDEQVLLQVYASLNQSSERPA